MLRINSDTFQRRNYLRLNMYLIVQLILSVTHWSNYDGSTDLYNGNCRYLVPSKNTVEGHEEDLTNFLQLVSKEVVTLFIKWSPTWLHNLFVSILLTPYQSHRSNMFADLMIPRRVINYWTRKYLRTRYTEIAQKDHPADSFTLLYLHQYILLSAR